MTRQLFVHRVVSLDVQLDDRLSVRSLIDRIRWLVRQDDWFKLYSREISFAGIGEADGKLDAQAQCGAAGRDHPQILDTENRKNANGLG